MDAGVAVPLSDPEGLASAAEEVLAPVATNESVEAEETVETDCASISFC